MKYRFSDQDKAEVRRMLGIAGVETIERAILLGCQRKTKALINNDRKGSLITSFRYFADSHQWSMPTLWLRILVRLPADTNGFSVATIP